MLLPFPADKFKRLPLMIEPEKLPHRGPGIRIVIPKLFPHFFVHKKPWKGCKPNFVCAGCPAERIIYLLRPYPGPWPFPTAGRAVPLPSIWSCTQWGLPCRLAYAWRGGLLPHLFTLASTEAAAVYFLWHFPSTHPRGWAAHVYPRLNRSYAASRPVVFGLSSPGNCRERSSALPRWVQSNG
jgi:hypothetical protein